MALVEKACSVCGMVSHRVDWQSVAKPVCEACAAKTAPAKATPPAATPAVAPQAKPPLKL
jgi:hypothetical protein